MNYEIEGLKIEKMFLENPKYRHISYKAFLCRISIATDDMGTQVCFNGQFFGPFHFRNVEEGVECLRENRKIAIKFFRKAYLDYLKYKFSRGNLKHLYWRFRHYFDSDFYFNR